MNLPGFNFSKLWIDDVSDNTKDTIWKYLQLILFNIIGNTQDKIFLEILQNYLKL